MNFNYASIKYVYPARGGSRNFKRGGTYSDSDWQPDKLGSLGACPLENFAF